MKTLAIHRERAHDPEIPPANVPVLVVLFALWVASIVAYFEAFLNAATAPPVYISHNPFAALVVAMTPGAAAMTLVALTLPLGALLILTRLCLPLPDRDTLGMLTGASIVMFDVAVLGDRYQVFKGSAVAPLLGAVISMGALRIVITAALRSWNVRARRG